MQKMRRSVENAETVGLFPTRSYQPDGPGPMPSPPSSLVRGAVVARRSPRTEPSPSPHTRTDFFGVTGSGIAALSSPGIQALLHGPVTPPATPVVSSASSLRGAPSRFTYHYGDRKTFAFHTISYHILVVPSNTDFYDLQVSLLHAKARPCVSFNVVVVLNSTVALLALNSSCNTLAASTHTTIVLGALQVSIAIVKTRLASTSLCRFGLATSGTSC
jgi:hypothetical protein